MSCAFCKVNSVSSFDGFPVSNKVRTYTGISLEVDNKSFDISTADRKNYLEKSILYFFVLAVSFLFC